MSINNNVKQFHVFVDENSHYMDESCRRLHGIYNSYNDAYTICRILVEESVLEFFNYDNTEEENFIIYSLYGIDPWFDPCGEGESFSSFDYAKKYIHKLLELKPFIG